MIAPGVLCPKCKGPVTDERANKRTEKSPDYQCANMLCTDASGKYRTGIWLEKGNGSGAETSAGGEMGKPNTGTSASAPSAEPPAKKPTMRHAYKEITAWVMDEILPMYCEDELTMTAADVAAITATLFIQACKSGKVE
jgi:hypothetical protein